MGDEGSAKGCSSHAHRGRFRDAVPLAGEPQHVLLVPRLADFGLMEFSRAKEAIAKGRACVLQALPMLQRHK